MIKNGPWRAASHRNQSVIPNPRWGKLGFFDRTLTHA